MHYLTDSITKTSLDSFTISEARMYFDATDENEPFDALYRAALDTRYGNSYLKSFTVSQYEDYLFLSDHKGDYWPASTNSINTWTISNRALSGDADKYFDTLEHNLNTAIYYSATKMNFLINMYYKGGGCEGTTGNDGPMEGTSVSIPIDVPVNDLTELFSVT